MSPLSPCRFLVALGALLLVLLSGLTFLYGHTTRLRDAAAEAAAREVEWQTLRGQQAQLAAGLPDSTERQTMRDAARLLDVERAALASARTEFQRVSLATMARPAASPPAATIPEVPLSRDRPEATMQSVIEAVQTGNADQLANLLDFDAKARTEAEAFFASLPADLQEEYHSPERLVAHVMAAKTRANYATTNVLADTPTGSDDRTLRLALYRENGQFRSATFHLHRAPDGWRLRVPTRVIEGYRALVTGYVPRVVPVGAPEEG